MYVYIYNPHFFFNSLPRTKIAWPRVRTTKPDRMETEVEKEGKGVGGGNWKWKLIAKTWYFFQRNLSTAVWKIEEGYTASVTGARTKEYLPTPGPCIRTSLTLGRVLGRLRNM